MPRPRPWTDDELVDAVANSATLQEVCEHLGISAGGQTYASIREQIRRLGINASHISATAGPHPQRQWSDDDLRDAVRESRTVSDVLRRLNYAPSGGMHRVIKSHIRRLGLDTSHFVGQASNRGRRRSRDQVAASLESRLVRNSYTRTSNLRMRLIRAGLKEARCEWCGLDSWRGEPLPLHLDHINGDPCDNRLENLRILCPNCHSQTETWCGRRRPA